MSAKNDDNARWEEVGQILTRIVEEVVARASSRTQEASNQQASSTTETTAAVEKPGDFLADEFPICEPATDMVVLRNLEITPPPPNPEETITNSDSKTNDTTEKPDTEDAAPGKPVKRAKRKSSPPENTTTSPNLNGSSDSGGPGGAATAAAGGRAKRQRTQTRLFQAGDVARATSSSSLDELLSPVKPARKSTTRRRSNARQSNPNNPSSTTSASSLPAATPKPSTTATSSTASNPILGSDQQDVIIWDKNDYVAVRNEDDSFYLAQLMEDVKSNRAFVKVKWLDTSNDGKTYYLTEQRDSIPTQSIIFACDLRKLESKKKGEQLFELNDQERNIIIDRLKRSLNVRTDQYNSSQETIAASGNDE